MSFIRRNYYNPTIFMINRDELLYLSGDTDDPELYTYILDLVDLYDEKSNYLQDIPFEQRCYPHRYIGLSIHDIRNRALIELAIKRRQNKCLYDFAKKDIPLAYGMAAIEGQYRIAKELFRLKSVVNLNDILIEEIITMTSEDTLNYMLTFAQTKGHFENDALIAFFNGKSFVVLDVKSGEQMPPYVMDGCKKLLM